MTRPHPEALPHGQFEELFPGVHFITGSCDLPTRVPMRFSRNMCVFAEKDGLVLVNSVRLDEAGLAALEELGEVRHVIRLAGFHGMDDPFYAERYGAQVLSVKADYRAGFGKQGTPYFIPDVVMEADTALPIAGARLVPIASSRPGEALILVEREGGILVSGDCLQNWARADRYFNWPARLMMKAMGFLKPHNVGPGWLKAAKPDVAELKELAELPFAHVLPAHGAPVIGAASDKYAPALKRL